MRLPPPEICQRILALHVWLGSPDAKDEVRDELVKLMTDHGLTWNDWPAFFAAMNVSAAPLLSRSKIKSICSLHVGMGDPVGARAKLARRKLIKKLEKYKLNWSADLRAILAAERIDKNPPSMAQAATDAPTINVLKLLLALLEDHIAITAEERMAAALWVLHTWVFDLYTITPRLALLSLVRGCGKTTLLVLIEKLAHRAFRTDNISAAAIYHHLESNSRSVFLADEGDNQNLLFNHVLRSVFNSGHRRGRRVTRFVGGRVQSFPTFAPLAIAAIGTLPLPLLHRSIVINMNRASSEAQLRRIDEDDLALAAAHAVTQQWAATCSLRQDCEIPASLRNRAADNWRVLLAIADDLGYGNEARAAAVALCADRPDEDVGVVLLRDIRTMFQTQGIDWIPRDALVDALIGLDDFIWAEFTGPQDNRSAHKLTKGELAQLLKPFQIRAKPVWPLHRKPGDKSFRGFKSEWFEAAWRSYCADSDTSTQSRRIIALAKP